MVSKKKSKSGPVEAREEKCMLCGKPASGIYILFSPNNTVPLCKSCAEIEHARKVK
ncbi:MAG: hypothetical protein ACP5SJ_00270 [Candidatus Micrarchaeia archaeon]